MTRVLQSIDLKSGKRGKIDRRKGARRRQSNGMSGIFGAYSKIFGRWAGGKGW